MFGALFLAAIYALRPLPVIGDVTEEFGFEDARILVKMCEEQGELIVTLPENDQQILCLSGYLGFELFDKLNALDLFGISIVVADSRGGVHDYTVDLAERLGVSDYDLIVTGECLSACANTLFVAARQKYVLAGSKLGWQDSRYNPREVFLEAIRSKEEGEWPGDEISDSRFPTDWQHAITARDRQSEIYASQNVSEKLMSQHFATVQCERFKNDRLSFLAEDQLLESTYFSPELRRLVYHYGVPGIVAERQSDFAAPGLHIHPKGIEPEFHTARRYCLEAWEVDP